MTLIDVVKSDTAFSRCSVEITRNNMKCLSFGKVSHKVMSGCVPCPLIDGLFLAPNNILSIRKLLNFQCERFVRKWVKLLDSENCYIIELVILTTGEQFIENLAATKNHSIYLLGFDVVVALFNDHLKFFISKPKERRGGEWISKQALWRHDNERRSILSQDLSSHEMKYLRSSRWHADLHVVTGTCLLYTSDAADD